MFLLLSVVLVALVFEYLNGFHDTANAIATSISTRVLTPVQAICLATAFDLIGAFSGHAVAKTIGQGLVDINFVTQETILCALLAAIFWNLFTWFFGLPSSSSHALIGGLCGAALAAANGNWSVLQWCVEHDGHLTGIWPQVIKPLVMAPTFGLICGFVFMGFLMAVLQRCKPHTVNKRFTWLQILSSAWMSFSHGANDAQKTMGIITLSLFTATGAGVLTGASECWDFLKVEAFEVPNWVTFVSAIALAGGVATGGWRIIKTLGSKLVKMTVVNGFAAQSSAALVIHLASHWGIPLSTTHVISTSIMGVGATKRFGAVKWGVAANMIVAWSITLPITSLIGYFLLKLINMIAA